MFLKKYQKGGKYWGEKPDFVDEQKNDCSHSHHFFSLAKVDSKNSKINFDINTQNYCSESVSLV